MHQEKRAPVPGWTMAAVVLALAVGAATGQAPDEAVVLRGVDAAVQARVEHVQGFTDTERYTVYRGADETHPAAQMTVRTTYRKGAGKSYRILSESGSELARRFGLHPLLENEKTINQPGQVEQSWFSTANYEMHLQHPATERVNGRNCYALAIHPRHKATNMMDGTLWVDTQDFAIAQVRGTASKSPSLFAGTTHMMRQYANIDGYPMATRARAESNSTIFGRTVVTIDYSDYRLQTQPSR